MFTLTYVPTFHGIRPGDTVTYATPQGQTRRGRAIMVDEQHVVLNVGGKHGTPAVVTDRNYVSHVVAKRNRAR